MRSLRRFDLGGAGSAVLSLAAGALLLAMMALTVIDVAGRYLFAAPVPGAFEATEIMLALVVFAGLPIVTARREHVAVRLLVDRAPATLRSLLARVGDAVVTVLLAGAAYLLWERGETLARFGDATVLLAIPLAPVAFALATLSGAAALVSVFVLLRRRPR